MTKEIYLQFQFATMCRFIASGDLEECIKILKAQPADSPDMAPFKKHLEKAILVAEQINVVRKEVQDLGNMGAQFVKEMSNAKNN